MPSRTDKAALVQAVTRAFWEVVPSIVIEGDPKQTGPGPIRFYSVGEERDNEVTIAWNTKDAEAMLKIAQANPGLLRTIFAAQLADLFPKKVGRRHGQTEEQRRANFGRYLVKLLHEGWPRLADLIPDLPKYNRPFVDEVVETMVRELLQKNLPEHWQ